MDDASSKSEAATPQKRRDAEQKGMSLRSPELAMLIALGLGAATLALVLPPMAREMLATTHDLYTGAAGNASRAVPDITRLSLPGIKLVAVLFVASLALAVLAASAYGGLHFSAFPLKPDFSRLNPARGFKRVFSLHTLAETARATLKILMLCVLAWLLAKDALATLDELATGLRAAPALLLSLALKAIGWLAGMQLLFVLFDLWYARRRYLQQLRMSRTELRDEHRRQEGDPEIRRKRKQLQSTLLAQVRALGNVRDADVVITNPTHVAVALRYVPAIHDAPVIACAGRGTMAAMIRALARRHRVPLLRQPALARALMADHAVGDAIAREHQAPVVHVYRWLIARPGGAARFAS